MWILIDFMCNMNIFELLQWWLINEKIYAKNINAIQALECINIYMKIKKNITVNVNCHVEFTQKIL